MCLLEDEVVAEEGGEERVGDGDGVMGLVGGEAIGVGDGVVIDERGRAGVVCGVEEGMADGEGTRVVGEDSLSGSMTGSVGLFKVGVGKEGEGGRAFREVVGERVVIVKATCFSRFGEGLENKNSPIIVANQEKAIIKIL